jgi:hypothetical protein
MEASGAYGEVLEVASPAKTLPAPPGLFLQYRHARFAIQQHDRKQSINRIVKQKPEIQSHPSISTSSQAQPAGYVLTAGFQEDKNRLEAPKPAAQSAAKT